MERRRICRGSGWIALLLVVLFAAAPIDRAGAAAEEALPAPVNTAAPTISGQAEIGQSLTASPGSWTQDPGFQFQWERCREAVYGSSPDPPGELYCSAISGASAATYSVAGADEGSRLRVQVIASDDGGAVGVRAESAPTERVAELKPTMSASGKLSPLRLPGRGQAPATLRLGFTSASRNVSATPALKSFSFELSHNLSLHAAGLRSCSYDSLYRSAARVRRKCSAALVGHGEVRSELMLEGKYSPVEGRLTAYYAAGSAQELPRILARVQTQGPSPIVYVLPFRVEPEKGRFATRLIVPEMRHIYGEVLGGYTFPYGYERIASLNLVLGRSFAYRGERKSFVTASCPVPAGAVGTSFPLMRAELAYSYSASGPDGYEDLGQSVVTGCRT